MPIDSTPQAPKPKTAKPAPAKPVAMREARETGLMGIAQVGSVICVSRGLWADAATIKDYGPGLARETAALADQFDIVATAVDYLVGVGPFTAIIAVALPFTLQMLANHKRIDATKAGIAGIEDPDDLAARMIAETDRARLVVKLAQQRERAELDKMIAELEGEANA